MPTIESSISRTPLHNDLSTAKSSIHSTYEPSSQAADKYIIAEKIQNALRQPPAHTQVSSTLSISPSLSPPQMDSGIR